jgi:hypothetical protein
MRPFSSLKSRHRESCGSWEWRFVTEYGGRTGLPVSVGIAETKTLAQGGKPLLAKRFTAYRIGAESGRVLTLDLALERTPIGGLEDRPPVCAAPFLRVFWTVHSQSRAADDWVRVEDDRDRTGGPCRSCARFGVSNLGRAMHISTASLSHAPLVRRSGRLKSRGRRSPFPAQEIRLRRRRLAAAALSVFARAGRYKFQSSGRSRPIRTGGRAIFRIGHR